MLIIVADQETCVKWLLIVKYDNGYNFIRDTSDIDLCCTRVLIGW